MAGRFLGYSNPGSLDFRTNNTFRLRINEQLNFTPAYLGGGGYVGWLNGNYTPLGYTPMGIGFKPEGFVGINTNTPRTMLHISGPSNFGNGTGYRPWMSTGTYYSEHSNNMYVGMYRRPFNSLGEPTGGPVDGVVNWGDDIGSTGNRLRVIFTPTIAVLGGTPNAWDRDLEMMSYWGNRNIGIGDFINFTAGPQRHLHVHNAFGLNDFIQISTTGTIGGATAPLASGFHLGVATSTAQLIQYENNHLITYTNSAAGASERMRITHVGAPGVTMPGVTANSTRIGIPLNPAITVSNPKSLIHLGFNGTATDGWRSWMEQGIFNSRASDHVYIGIKPEIGFADKNDAVIGWGDNDPAVVGGTGPDNLRFIFSKQQTVAGTTSNGRDGFNGQEVARFTPACDACPINKPSFGIGDFAPSGPQGPGTPNYVDATLDVDGDVNIRSVQNNNGLDQVLVRDPADKGRVYWRDAATLGAGGGVTADNGLSIQPAGNVQFGNDLGNITADLLNDREVNMVDNNIYFKGQAANNNGVLNAIGLGYNIVIPGTPLRSKLSVYEGVGVVPYIFGAPNIYPSFQFFPGGANSQRGTEAISGINQDINTNAAIPILQAGVYGESSGNQAAQGINAGGHFYATNAGSANLGVYGVARSSTTSIGGFFVSQNNPSTSGISIGAYGRSLASDTRATGVRGEVFNPSPTADNYGVYGAANGPGALNIGVYGTTSGGAPNASFAGYFDGDVFVNGPTSGLGYVFASDQMFKTDIDSISNATSIINQLNPRQFYYDTTNAYNINFSSQKQYGFIAQEVETVLPELVSNITKPAERDSLGNVIIPSVTYKNLNYIELIAVMMKGMQEQQQTINNLTTQVNDLMAAVNNCCSQGNNINTPNINNNQNQFNVTNIDVKLTDNDCVLNVNSPNPFRDNTTINYLIPETANFAQIIFYNSLGQAIKIVDIDEKGAGRLNVYGEDLRSGMYSYSLIIDGNVCETHKMIKQ